MMMMNSIKKKIATSVSPYQQFFKIKQYNFFVNFKVPYIDQL